jgi:hypothetical protein
MTANLNVVAGVRGDEPAVETVAISTAQFR